MTVLAQPASKVGIDWLQPSLAEARRWLAPLNSVPPELRVTPCSVSREVELHGSAGDGRMGHGGHWRDRLASTYYVVAISAILAGGASWISANAGPLYQAIHADLVALRSGEAGWFLA